jgi:hypothetical protein
VERVVLRSRFPRQLLPALLYLLRPCSRAPAAQALRKAASRATALKRHFFRLRRKSLRFRKPALDRNSFKDNANSAGHFVEKVRR